MSTDLPSRAQAPARPARREPAKPTQRPSGHRTPTPLTHHEIMGLMGPFSRRQHRLDLERSDRARRHLSFHPEPIDAADEHPALTSTLRLELPSFGRPRRLVRTLAGEGLGGAATMTVEGQDLEVMLAAMDRVTPARQVVCRNDMVLIRSYRMAGDDLALTLVAGQAIFDGLALNVSEVDRSVVYQLDLTSADERPLQLPQDFFAVLGPNWRPTKAQRGQVAWRAGVRPPLREPARTPALEQQLTQAVAHCRRTFAMAPTQFHRTFAAARWRVVAQRLMPLLFTLAGFSGAVGLALVLPKTPLWHMVMSQVPIVLLCTVSLLKEPPKLELPPLPGPLPASAWEPRAPS